MNRKNATATAPALVRKAVRAIDLKIVDEAAGIVEAMVNTLERVDLDGEVILDGAFDRFIDRGGRLPKVCWFHQLTQPVGKCLETRQVGNQQWVRAQFNLETQRGREAFSDVAFGAIEEWSVGFYVTEAEYQEREGKRRRCIRELEWVEFSPVLVGASPGTTTVSAKSRERVEKSAQLASKSLLAGSYEAISAALYRALIDRVYGSFDAYMNDYAAYLYIEGTYPAYCIACQHAGDEETYWRVEYTVSEDGTLALGTMTEVEPVYVPVSNPDSAPTGDMALTERAAPDTASGGSPAASGTDAAQAMAHLTLTAARMGLPFPAGAVGAGH